MARRLEEGWPAAGADATAGVAGARDGDFAAALLRAVHVSIVRAPWCAG
ncbi:MAG: hypothetical protein J2P54_15590 [Bradyrhizobiaceae bacterium]|nr:hypothetical protein [Bradyrhizobiaceae bacterium]